MHMWIQQFILDRNFDHTNIYKIYLHTSALFYITRTLHVYTYLEHITSTFFFYFNNDYFIFYTQMYNLKMKTYIGM